MNEANMQATIEGACREKFWDERSLEEKTEAVRTVLLRLEGMITSTAKVAQEGFKVAHLHQHGQDGAVLVHAAKDQWGHPAHTIIGDDPSYSRHIFSQLRSSVDALAGQPIATRR